jgi:hypothetical protein
MTGADILDASKALLDLVNVEEAAVDSERPLALALDRLALAYHFADAPFDETQYPDPARADYQALYERIKVRFPRLGYYDDKIGLVEKSERSIGDAAEDLADIAVDLQDVLLRRQANGERDALWHFRFGFETHWGRHLRCLQLYLHELAS